MKEFPMSNVPRSLPRPRALTVVLSLALALVAGACSLLGLGGRPAPGMLTGRVLDTGGNPVANASVRVPNGPSATTDGTGGFRLTNVRSGRVRVDFTAGGFAETMKVYPVLAGRETRQDVALARESTVAFNAGSPGHLALPGGGGVFIPANALVRRDGQPATGTVTARVAFIDPRDPDQIVAAPGDLAVGTGAQRVPLTSGGMVRVTVTDATGAGLELASGRTAEIRLPANLVRRTGKDREDRPDSVPVTGVYLFNTTAGQWQWVDTASVASGSNFVSGQTPSLGAWINLDKPEVRTCVDVRVTNPGGAPRANTYVILFGVDYNGYTQAYTDADGRARLLARRSSTVRLNSGGKTTVVGTPAVETPCVDAGTLSF
jgi:hypothetical protein